jgi:orotidine-5'-phosphate decarboxylase
LNDIGNTAKKYAYAAFEFFGVDAVTLSPYLGEDSIKQFTKYEDKGKFSFILVRSSNPSARDFQDLLIGEIPLYQIVAKKAKEWNCGAITGATYPNDIKIVREIIGDDLPILIPGIGQQGGKIDESVKNGVNDKGEMAIINSSRGIIYAGRNEKFAKKARESCLILKDEINRYR